MNMEKQQLLEALRDVWRLEESVSVIYFRHADALLERSGLATPILQAIRNELQAITRETDAHSRIIMQLITQIEASERDDF